MALQDSVETPVISLGDRSEVHSGSTYCPAGGSAGLQARVGGCKDTDSTHGYGHPGGQTPPAQRRERELGQGWGLEQWGGVGPIPE